MDEHRQQIRKCIAASFRKARRDKNYTQHDLAKAASITQTSVANWETGKYLMALDSAWQIADVLGISMDELIGRHFIPGRGEVTMALDDVEGGSRGAPPPHNTPIPTAIHFPGKVQGSNPI